MTRRADDLQHEIAEAREVAETAERMRMRMKRLAGRIFDTDPETRFAWHATRIELEQLVVAIVAELGRPDAKEQQHP